MVENLINPLIGIFLGKIDLSNLVFSIGEAHFKFGAFLNSVINFLIIAFVVFLIVKAVNKALPKKEEAPADPEPSAEEKYLEEIVALLKKQDANK